MAFYSTLRWLLRSKVARAFYKVVLGFSILLVAMVLMIRVPSVQAYLASKITSYIDQKTGFHTEIKHVYIAWFDEIELEGLTVRDLQDSLMISSGELLADLDFASLIQGKNILLNKVIVENGELFLTKHISENEINIAQFIKALGTGSEKNSKGELKVDIYQITLKNVDLAYRNFDKVRNDEQIDFSDLKIAGIDCEVDHLSIDSSSTSAIVSYFSAQLDGLGQIEELSSNLEFSPKGLKLEELNFRSRLSYLKGDISLLFDNISDLGNFQEKVEIISEIEPSSIHTDELDLFLKVPDQLLSDRINFSGKFFGKIGSMQGEGVKLEMKNLIDFKADLFVLGLPKVTETFLDIDFSQLDINLQNLFRRFVKESISFPKSINELSYQGEFTGFLTDFVTKGDFSSSAGDFYTDVNLKVKEYPSTSAYEGFVSTQDFDIGSIIGDTSLLQKVTLTGSLNGEGLSLKTADFFLKSEITSVGVNGYEFSNITTDGEFKSQFFEGDLQVDDPNLQLKVDGRIDMSESKEEVIAFVEVDSVNLQQINLTNQNITVSTQSNLKIQGFGLDELTGTVVLQDLYLKKDQKSLLLDSIMLDVRQVNENKIIELLSDGIEAQLSGNFRLSQVGTDIIELTDELLLELTNDSTKLSSYYENKDKQTQEPYSLQFYMNVDEPNQLISPFLDEFYISEGLQVHGGLYHGQDTDLSLGVSADSLRFRGNAISECVIDLHVSKTDEASKVTSQLEISSERQLVENRLNTEALNGKISWNGDQILFGLDVNRMDSTSAAAITGTASLLNDQTVLSFDSSIVKLDNHLFHFDPGNRITLQSGQSGLKVLIEDLVLTDGMQFLSLAGTWDRLVDLDMTVGDLNVANFNALAQRELNGTSDGFINFRRDQSGSYFTGNLTIDQLLVDNFLVGNLNAATTWNELEEKIQVDFNIEREGVDAIKILGDVALGEEQVLDLKANFDGAQLTLLAPYFKGVASGISGDITGEVDIGGTLSYPIIKGQALLENGTAQLDYLKTTFLYSGELTFGQDKVSFEKVDITDFKGNKAFAKGNITHNGFRDLLIDVEADLFNFNVLNTSRGDNKLFYGEAYATGKTNIYGTPKNIKISANVATDKNTRIFVPLSEESSTDIKEYISFVDFSDTLNIVESLREEADLRGIELDFVVDVTPDAYFELIFDLKSGDIIRGRGDGDIKLTVNTEGDFSMFGDYEIREGGYNFTLYNIINKEFAINPGSRISWYGDPYKAILDIEATYSQIVSIAPIVSSESSNARANSIVKLFLDGEMLEPEINFDIDFEDYPLDQSVFVEAFKSSIKADKQELNRQVFSLLILKKLFERNEGFVAGQAIGLSVSEFVSNQLSYWITQVDDNLEIDVDISSLDADAFNAFRLRLSYKFLDGRLRITRGGGFGTVNPEAQTDANRLGNIIGDITLEYLLTPDGRLRVKMFTRNNQNVLEDDYAFETGASLRYVRSFDYLKEVWLKNQVKKVRFVDAEGNEVNK